MDIRSEKPPADPSGDDPVLGSYMSTEITDDDREGNEERGREDNIDQLNVSEAK